MKYTFAKKALHTIRALTTAGTKGMHRLMVDQETQAHVLDWLCCDTSQNTHGYCATEGFCARIGTSAAWICCSPAFPAS